MLIINADDWGWSKETTDAALSCYTQGRITSVSAMVFMGDSERAAMLAAKHGIPTGLHLNFTQRFTNCAYPSSLQQHHECIRRFLKLGKYAVAFYNPLLRESFRIVYDAQYEEFHRVYGHSPSHIDGHQHMHLCANMLLDPLIPSGERVRRSFSFRPGERKFVNRAYRKFVDRRLAQRYRLTDFFFCLYDCLQRQQIARVIELSESANVEIMTHPIRSIEYRFLMGEEWNDQTGSFRDVSYVSREHQPQNQSTPGITTNRS